MDELISAVAIKLGFTFKPEQRRVVNSFVAGNDVFGDLFWKVVMLSVLTINFDDLRMDGLQSILSYSNLFSLCRAAEQERHILPAVHVPY